MEKDIRNIDIVTCKLKPTLIRATNQRLEVTRDEKQKREKMVEKRKTKTIVAKRRKAGKENSLSSEEKKNYESNTKDKTDPDQARNNKNLLQL